MKKILIMMTLLIGLFSIDAHGESGVAFKKVKPKMLSAYSALEENVHEMSLIYEKDVGMMVEMDRWIFFMVNNDLQTGGLVIKEILALQELQAVQESTPPEAVEILSKASLEGVEALTDIEARLSENEDLISHKEGKVVVKKSISLVVRLREMLESLNVSKE